MERFDPGRDAFTGLLISKGGSGIGETDPTKYQQWIVPAGGTVLDGPASLTLWSAVKDFQTSTGGSITAYLVDSNSTGSSVTEISSSVVPKFRPGKPFRDLLN